MKTVKGSNQNSTSLNDLLTSNEDALQILNKLILDKKVTIDEIKEAKSSCSKLTLKNEQEGVTNVFPVATATTTTTAIDAGKETVAATTSAMLTNTGEVSVGLAAASGSNNGPSINSSDNKKNEKKRKKQERKEKKARVEYMTRHIAFRFHYDGSTYNGLAENRNRSNDNSVEKVLFAALEKTCLIDSSSSSSDITSEEECDNGVIIERIIDDSEKNGDDSKGDLTRDKEEKRHDEQSIAKVGNNRDECKYSRSGRTDKGVSAFGQVIALRVRSGFPVGTMIETNGTKKPLEESDMTPNSLTGLKCWVPVPPQNMSNKKRKRLKNRKREESNEFTNIPLKEREIFDKDYCQLVNNVLPSTVRMLGWSPVSKDFSARFSTSSRTYRYFFIQRDLNLDDMQKALDSMVGTHDFRNLCKMNCEEVDNFVRVVNYAKIVQTGYSLMSDVTKLEDKESKTKEESANYRRPCYFEIQGQAFLWHQIRCIASILFMVGLGHESPSVVKELLDIGVNPAKPSYPFAPEKPLVLHKCDYKNLKFGHTVKNLWKVSCDLETKWEELTLAAERIRDGLETLGTDASVCANDLVQSIFVMDDARNKKISRNNTAVSKRDYWQSKVDVANIWSNEFGLEGDSEVSPLYLPWKDALKILHKYGFGKPENVGPRRLHIPLMQRSRGTTYEEKIKSIMATDRDRPDGPPSKRRKELYENNIKKKKLSKKEDELFYKKMLNEGGSGMGL